MQRLQCSDWSGVGLFFDGRAAPRDCPLFFGGGQRRGDRLFDEGHREVGLRCLDGRPLEVQGFCLEDGFGHTLIEGVQVHREASAASANVIRGARKPTTQAARLRAAVDCATS